MSIERALSIAILTLVALVVIVLAFKLIGGAV